MKNAGFTPRQVLEALLNTPDYLLDKPITVYDPDDDTIFEGYMIIQDVTLDDSGRAMAVFCKQKDSK